MCSKLCFTHGAWVKHNLVLYPCSMSDRYNTIFVYLCTQITRWKNTAWTSPDLSEPFDNRSEAFKMGDMYVFVGSGGGIDC